MEDDTTGAIDEAVVEAICAEVRRLCAQMTKAQLNLDGMETGVLAGMRHMGAQVVTAAIAARGLGKPGSRVACRCGGEAVFDDYRSRDVQTLLGWITVRRAYFVCPGCRKGQFPLDQTLGITRDSSSPGVRQLASRFGALLPFGQAAETLKAATAVEMSANTLRTVTEAVGARQEAQQVTAAETAWDKGLAEKPGPARETVYVAMDGVFVRDRAGHGMEAKVGVVAPTRRDAGGEQRLASSYAVSFAEAARFGPRLALEAHRRGVERANQVVVLGDGAAWIWQLAEEHFPDAIHIVDWYHASEHIWELGQALHGEGTAKTAAWVKRQLDQLAKGEVLRLVRAWNRLKCSGKAATVRDEQVTYFTNQASRMAYDQYRAKGLDVGSGMVESANKSLIAMREKGPGMRWRKENAQAVANLRVLLENDQWAAYWDAA